MGTIATGPGPTETAPADGFAPPTAATTKITDALYDGPKADPDGFYRVELGIKTTLDNNLTRLSDRLGLTLAAQAAERREVGDLARASGLDGNLGLVELVHTSYTDARLAAARPGVDPAAAQAELAATNEATRTALREQYGAKDAEDLLQRVNKFVDQQPKLKAIMRTGNVGSRLDVVTALCEHVRTVNFR